ncbi:PoNe immunity protein domain-containing protein [Snodgrassella communis]|uniref:PoNi C-terminal domain-containing protein n=1 Tax=Snodgrassella alvi TaxID=1196083 RepID=A0A2N9XNI0_9NEIS|nr:hypothetical protein BHC48_07920 [Snodgrassella communis]
MRKAGYKYVDSHLFQQGNSHDYCSFYGYQCFEVAAVAYIKEINDNSLHHFIYYAKDMVKYTRNNNKQMNIT